MVKKLTLLALALLAMHASAQDSTEPSYDAQSLKNRLKNGADEKITAADRIKSARGDKSSLKMLQDNDLNYKLPNGQFVTGILLPNGKLSPAIKTKLGVRPACVTKEYELVPGTWDKQKELTTCNIPPSELAYIDESVRFESSAVNKGIVSNKYAAKPSSTEEKETIIQNSIGAATFEKRKESQRNSSNKTVTTQHEREPDTAHATRQYQSTGGGYVPAPRNNTNLNSKAGTIESTSTAYGIPRGTWIRAELKRHAKSSDSSNIEFVITESVIGKFKTLEFGTVLFASKSFNTLSKRLEALTSVAVTPDGDEIPGISAYVYASDQTAGLSGTIIRDREGEAITAGKTGVLSAVAGALSGGSGIATGVVSNISGELISNEKSNIKDAPSAYIQVAPQTVWLRTAQKI